MKTRKLGLAASIAIRVVVAIGVVYLVLYVRSVNQWREYNETFGKRLALPDNLNTPHAKENWLPGLVGKDLTVRIYKPDTTDDENLRIWIAQHNRSSAFEPTFKRLTGELGEWDAKRGAETIQFTRFDENGWISISVFQRQSESQTAATK